MERALGAHSSRLLYVAKQKGTEREVFLELMSEASASEEEVDLFLQELRAKTKLSESFPFMGVVYEARRRNGYLFFTYQEAAGTPLVEVLARRNTLETGEILEILKMLCSVQKVLLESNIASERIGLDKLMATGDGRMVVHNIALGGTRGKDDAARDMKDVAVMARPLISPGVPGSTRLSTLFQWMEKGVEGKRLSWEDVENLVCGMESQLAQNVPGTVVISSKMTKKTKGYFVAAVIALVVAVLLAVGYNNGSNGEVEASDGGLQKPVFSGVSHTNVEIMPPDGESIFYCDAHEVTIRSYKRFLDSLGMMPEDFRLKTYAHPDQPSEKVSYVPEDWDEIWSAAKEGKVWQGIRLTINSPVFNVDWWDANAYANWAKRRLPTREEWCLIAKMAKVPERGDSYVSVEDYKYDHGERSLCGFASGVSEWTASKEVKPDEPMLPPRHVVCGGNYRNPGILNIQYVPDPGERSRTIGFRTIADKSKK